ncbi:hypothetical protein JCM19301_2685 [Jejuia pallidilutea]|uniref:Uncharacterized protein n=1 Tax=Jejuia pallidilutea TaxID=504487 RepID=A0A090VTK1_9FLAO|nr:hypothetical protein JCM19301_2685 [Jejuia pallidilutea]
MAPKDKLEGDALPISQQAYIYRTYLEADNTVALTPKSTDNGFIFSLLMVVLKFQGII